MDPYAADDYIVLHGSRERVDHSLCLIPCKADTVYDYVASELGDLLLKALFAARKMYLAHIRKLGRFVHITAVASAYAYDFVALLYKHGKQIAPHLTVPANYRNSHNRVPSS